jgi:phosphatidylglycerophosphatase A
MRIIKQKNPVNEEYKVNIFVKTIGSGFFSGYMPFAQGTFGSLVGLIIYLIPGFSKFIVVLIAVIVGFIIGILSSEIMRRRYGEDPPEVVIDEIVGLWFTYFIGYLVFEFFLHAKSFNPTLDLLTKLIFGITGFIIFRIFDIIKLQPAKYFDQMKSGYGIMMDDISAGFYSGILTAIMSHFLWYRIFVHIHF